MTVRLPLRIEPMPGEWWRSYLLRVAVTYGVHPNDVMTRVHGIARVERRHHRWSGIAMADAAAAKAGAVVNLKAHEIQVMHLSAYDGSVLDFDDCSFALFDPGASRDAPPLQQRLVGLLVNATTDRHCPNCLAENPHYRATSWRLLVHVVCTRHQVLLTSGSHSGRGVEVSAAVTTAQMAVLSRLSPSAENAAFFAHLEAQLSSLIKPRKARQLQLTQRDPQRLLEAFTVAVDRATSPGYPDYQGLADWSPPSAAKYLVAPHTLGFAGPIAVFPHLLPTDLFAEGLSDLLHRAQIRHARAIASVGAQMAATGNVLDSAVLTQPERRRLLTKRSFLEHLIQLEREGRAERFWKLCGTAAEELTREGVDYRSREKVCVDENAFVMARTAEPSAYPRTIRTWLVDQWACTYTSSNVRPSVRDGSIEHFDRLFGPGMRGALSRRFEDAG